MTTENNEEQKISRKITLAGINMHSSSARTSREPRARLDAPSATSRNALVILARRCSNSNNFFLNAGPFFFSTAYFSEKKAVCDIFFRVEI